MTVELVPRFETEKVAPVVPLDVPKRCVPECDMVKRGEIEVVMTTQAQFCLSRSPSTSEVRLIRRVVVRHTDATRTASGWTARRRGASNGPTPPVRCAAATLGAPPLSHCA